jgi:hypothetical protein
MTNLFSLILMGQAHAEGTVLITPFTGVTRQSSLELLTEHSVESLTPLLSNKAIVVEEKESTIRSDNGLPEICEDDACLYMVGQAMNSQYVLTANVEKEKGKYICTMKLLYVESRTEISTQVLTEATTSGIDKALPDGLAALTKDLRKHEAALAGTSPLMAGIVLKFKDLTGTTEEPVPEVPDEISDDLGREVEIDTSDDLAAEGEKEAKDEAPVKDESGVEVEDESENVEETTVAEFDSGSEDSEPASESPPPFNGIRIRGGLGLGNLQFNQKSDGPGAVIPPDASYSSTMPIPSASAELLLLNKITIQYQYSTAPHSTQVIDEPSKESITTNVFSAAFRKPIGANQYSEFGAGLLQTNSIFFEYERDRTDASTNDTELTGGILSASYVSRGVKGQFEPLSVRATVSESFGSKHTDSSLPVPFLTSVDIAADYEYMDIEQIGSVLLVSLNTSADFIHYKAIESNEEAKVRAMNLSVLGGVGLRW